jgi:hypothetical protein
VSKRRIDIERLEIRLKGVSVESARAAAGDLGGELGRSATPWPGPATQRAGSLDRVDAGTVHLPTGATPSELRRAIAGRVVAAIRSTSH